MSEQICTCNSKKPSYFPLEWEDQLATWIYKSITQLCREKPSLLDFAANERSISHRLAMHLQKVTREWTVDCEYNRVGNSDDTKHQPRLELCASLPQIADQLQEYEEFSFTKRDLKTAEKNLKCSNDDVNSCRESERRALPDIIVHKRRCKRHNLLVIEMKTGISERSDVLIDLAKLYSFTLTQRSDGLNNQMSYPRYRFGLFLDFQANHLKKAILFENGKPTRLGTDLRLLKMNH